MEKLISTYKGCRNDIFKKDRSTYPGKALEDMVLKPAYNSAKNERIEPMLALNEAQLIMLVEQGIVSKSDGKIIAEGLENIDYGYYKNREYTGEFEDLFFEIENDLIQRTNGLGGNIHIARSRNDMSLCMDHMVVRDVLYDLIALLVKVQNTVKLFAEEHKDTLYVAHTHTQHAQPSVFGHYFLGVFDVLDRDIARLVAAYHKVNSSPMGAAAITTSGFPISRERVAELLGFSSVIENSFDAIGNIDFNTETAVAVMLCSLDLGRVVTDMVTWATEELNMIRVADGYISTSSIMPQKRNPIALEHLRSSLSMVKGLSDAVVDGYFKSPYGDISDHEDIEPILMQAISLLKKNYELFNSVIGTMDVNKDLLSERAHESFSVVTEMADTIVRHCNIPFRKAHHVVAALVKEAEKKGYTLKNIDKPFFCDVYKNILGENFTGSFEIIKASLDPVNFIEIREVHGGVGKKAMNDMLISAARKQSVWVKWLENEEKVQLETVNKRENLIDSLLQ